MSVTHYSDLSHRAHYFTNALHVTHLRHGRPPLQVSGLLRHSFGPAGRSTAGAGRRRRRRPVAAVSASLAAPQLHALVDCERQTVGEVGARVLRQSRREEGRVPEAPVPVTQSHSHTATQSHTQMVTYFKNESYVS